MPSSSTAPESSGSVPGASNLPSDLPVTHMIDEVDLAAEEVHVAIHLHAVHEDAERLARIARRRRAFLRRGDRRGG